MKVIYIAGKFRGPNSWEIECNIRKAETLALQVWKAGAAALCPHANTRFFQGAAPDLVWLEGDLEMLSRCDGMVLVDNWRESEGAKAEVAHAHRLKIPVFEDIHELLAWFKAQEIEGTRPIGD